MKTLKTLFLLSGIALLSLTSCKTEEKSAENSPVFTVSGEIKGLNGNLFYRHPDREYTREHFNDSIIVTDGKFSFTDSISKLTLIRFSTGFKSKANNLYKTANGGGYFPVKSMYLMVYAAPGAEIKVTGEATDFMNAYPTGDAYNDGLADINKLVFPNTNESANLLVKSTYETDTIIINKLKKASDSIGKIGEAAQLKYVQDHPKSLAALWYLEDMIMRGQINDSVAAATFHDVSADLASTDSYISTAERIKGIEATKEGMMVPAIKSTATVDGSEFDIASLRGKYVLIDFWGVWCGPCVAEMPQVKAFQEKYKDQLVVLGINSGDTKEKMVEFLEKNDYTWQQLMSVKENTPDNFVNRFNVKGFPTKFILDPEGKIVKRYLGSGEDAFTLLEELMKS